MTRGDFGSSGGERLYKWMRSCPVGAEAAHNSHLFSQKCEFSHIFDDLLLFRLFRTDKIAIA